MSSSTSESLAGKKEDLKKEEKREEKREEKMEGKMKEIREGKAVMMFPDTNEVFYNPVQVFNRDLSIAVLNTFVQTYHLEKLEQQKKRNTKLNKSSAEEVEEDKEEHGEEEKEQNGKNTSGSEKAPQDDKKVEGGEGGGLEGVEGVERIDVLEALSATGLRAIRYSREVKGLSSIIANDLSASAVAAIKRNVQHNGIDPLTQVIPNEGDASLFMYMNNPSIPGKKGFTVVDLDPYGSAVPFLDSAFHCIQEGGLMCITCTDMAVLSGAHGDACWSKYGSMPLNTSSCHESALRILLRCLESHANKQRKYIVPLMSCSIDFYVRVFIRVYTSPMNVKRSASYYYSCIECESTHYQPVGNRFEEGNRKKYTPGFGPLAPQHCEECGGRFHVGGPLWTEPIHDTAFVNKVLEFIKKSKEEDFATRTRMLGMVTLISEELPNAPLYHDLPALSKVIHCRTPPLLPMKSAIMNLNYQVSATHCNMTALKTDAPSSVIWDIMRCWVKENPVKIRDGSRGKNILAKEPKFSVDFTERPDADAPSRKIKLVRFPENPQNWGPLAKAKSGKGKGTQEKSADHKEEMIAKRTMNQGKRQSKRLRRDQESEPMEADNEKPDDEESEAVHKDK